MWYNGARTETDEWPAKRELNQASEFAAWRSKNTTPLGKGGRYVGPKYHGAEVKSDLPQQIEEETQ